MKLLTNVVLFSCSILIIVPLLFAPSAPQVETHVTASFTSSRDAPGEVYVLDKKESVVKWRGSMEFIAEHAHVGYLYFSRGEMLTNFGKLAGGTVEVDMTSMAYHDKDHDNSPIKHLKSDDFFDVEKFPSSSFTITVVSPLNRDSIRVTGDMTIKGITNAVTFPAKMEVKSGVLHANGKLKIDRTKWDIRYGSTKFYSVVADDVISDVIELEMKIVARKR
jgi:polyisoprenoid-binding protein YceI